MRVVIFGVSARSADAIGTLTARKALTLAQAGHNVRVALADPRRAEPAIRPFLTHHAIGQLFRWADLVVFEFSQHLPVLGWLPRLAKRGVRTLVDYHGITPPHFWPSALDEPLVRGIEQLPLLCHADRIVTHSAFLRDELIERVGCDARRVVVLDHPVYIATDTPASGIDCHPLPARLPDPPTRVVLAVGRIAANKDLGTLLHALDRLRDERPPIHAALVGDAGELYALEAQRLRELAEQRRISDRVHWLGQLSAAELAAVYRRADVLVSASQHEGFCLPIREAQAHGTPVVAAHAAAQPQTLGHAGLSFIPGDAADLAKQLCRVFADAPAALSETAASAVHPTPRRIAVVHGRTAGGLEKSLRLMAQCLRDAGRSVEVLVEPTGQLLHRQLDQFDAVLVGPYCWPTAQSIARALPAKTVLVGAWHDEPAAHSDSVREAFAAVGGLIFHSQAEADFVAQRLGLNHPNARVVGAYLPLSPPTAIWRVDTAPTTAADPPYLLYCGRLIAEKNVPLLLEWMQQVQIRLPGRVRLCLVGAGNVPLPRCAWLSATGPVSESEKARLIAGALAVVQLSCNESLSWVALEALAVGVPVIAHRHCRVLADLLRQSGGGALVGSAAELTRTLRRALADPQRWQARGRRGRRFVAREYADYPRYTARLLAVLDGLRLPLREQMRRAGLVHATASDPTRWRDAWLSLCEQTASVGGGLGNRRRSRAAAAVRRRNPPAEPANEPTADALLRELRALAELPQGEVRLPVMNWLDRLKSWIKAKLFGQFRLLYVDRLARRQSAFNAKLLELIRKQNLSTIQPPSPAPVPPKTPASELTVETR